MSCSVRRTSYGYLVATRSTSAKADAVDLRSTQHVLIESHALEIRARLPAVDFVGAKADVLGAPEGQPDEGIGITREVGAERRLEQMARQRGKRGRGGIAAVARIE